MMTIMFVSLGCDKNLVDSEVMLGLLSEKGYGFITGTDGKDIFVHYSAINSDGYKTLEEGQTVTYDVVQRDRGPQASSVTVVTA